MPNFLSPLSICLLIGFSLAGATLLVGAIKGNSRLFRYNLIISGAVICISALLTYKVMTVRSGDDKIFWELQAFLTQVAGCVVSVLFMLGVLFRGKKDGSMGKELRACCFGIAIVLFAGFFVVYGQDGIATALQRRAVSAGGTSPLAKRIAWNLKYWDALAELEPSPQKERLIRMIQPSYYPPDEFWNVLLSLPPSPDRLAVITSFAHGITNVKWLAALYDQGDSEGLAVVFKKNREAYWGYLLEDIVALGRLDIVRDILRRGGESIQQDVMAKGAWKAIVMGNAEMVALFLDSGISPNTTFGYTSLLGWAARYNRLDVARLLLERGADLNKDCPIMDAVRHSDMIAFLVENGASPLCTRDGRTLLHQAAQDNVNTADMALLLRFGIPLDAPDKYGSSAFLLAASAGSCNALDSLAAAGADVTLRDSMGNTALHLVVKSLKQKIHPPDIELYRVMELLIKLSPDMVSMRDAEEKTPFDYATDEKSRAILQRGKTE